MTGIESNPSPQVDLIDTRRHDLDALRAFAMLVGILLHAALSFMEIPWIVRDRFQAPEFGYVVSAIHGFRMPLFFLLSGFFTAMLWQKRGCLGLLKHRAMRIALPLTLGCVTIVPLMWIVIIWAGSGNATFGAGQDDTGKDIWTAAAYGDIDAVRGYVERGVDIDKEEPIYGQSPLAWAVIGNRQEVVDYLLEAGADPSAHFREQSTALHTAAFFGRADAAESLIQAGADVNARNTHDETPLDTMRHGKGTTEFIGGLLRVPIDFDVVSAERVRIREMVDSAGGISGFANPSRGPLAALVQGLMLFPFFHHLWFLWFLCWLVVAFIVVASFAQFIPRRIIPESLVTSPLCLIWLVPLTMITQSLMHQEGADLGFGPDTSAGLIPIPQVLAHYAIFFGFGAMMYARAGATSRLGRGWRILLPLALLLLPIGLVLSYQMPLGHDVFGDGAVHRFASDLCQVAYAWLMIFGLMGLGELLLKREKPWVRYVSDSSYWLYLIHLPLIIVGQAMLRDVNLPAIVKLVLLAAVSTSILLLSYHFMVRYSWIGRLLNGPRSRMKRTRADVVATPQQVNP